MKEPRQTKEERAWSEKVIQEVAEHLKAEEYRYQLLADDCIELYLQGKNLTMKLQIFAFNRHLVVRAPEFIRNVDLHKMNILELIVKFMNDFLDIRYELSPDGHSLSASANHILEDGVMTRTQFIQTMMVVACLVDDSYPLFMKALYGSGPTPNDNDFTEDSVDDGDFSESEDEPPDPSFSAPSDDNIIN